MMGLIIVLGMLVDDAVVITENAVRRMEDGRRTLGGGNKGDSANLAGRLCFCNDNYISLFSNDDYDGYFWKIC